MSVVQAAQVWQAGNVLQILRQPQQLLVLLPVLVGMVERSDLPRKVER